MIRVAFIGSVSKEWMGGLNYFKNLLFALSMLENKELEVFIFIGKKTDDKIKIMFKKHANVIEDSLFDRNSLKWILNKIENKFFQTNIILEELLNNHKIQVLSHASIVNLKSIKSINWIADFQHLHLPEMFSKNDLESRNNGYLNLIQKSDKVILSSNDALKDFKLFAPDFLDKAYVLQFVSQPENSYFKFKKDDKVKLLKKYNLPEEFFYIPNQFWKHKNHMLVFETVKSIVTEGKDICIVCTGYLSDSRNIDYINELINFIKLNKLKKNIKLLGLIEYEDVFLLMKFSKAVINPSLFEGWSSTVEECKSVGKNMILSDLNVHKEQYHEAIFFKKESSTSLKDILINYDRQMVNPIGSLESRTKKFAMKYVDIVKEVINGSNR